METIKFKIGDIVSRFNNKNYYYYQVIRFEGTYTVIRKIKHQSVGVNQVYHDEVEKDCFMSDELFIEQLDKFKIFNPVKQITYLQFD